MNKLPLKTTRKLIELRNLLDSVSQISWSFSVLNKQHPISEVVEDTATELISAYEDLLAQVQGIVERYDKSNGTRTNNS